MAAKSVSWKAAYLVATLAALDNLSAGLMEHYWVVYWAEW